MKTNRIIALALLGLSTLNPQLSTCFAQGSAFTYHGFLTYQGAPANGAYDLTFTLFNASSGGATLGASNVFNDLAISNGLLTVTLDFGAQFDGNARWLQIAVRPGASAGAYTNVTPRQALTSTPYASYATSANYATTASTAGYAASASSASSATEAGTASDVVNGVVVKSLNGLRDNITLSPGANVTISPGGNTLTIASTGGVSNSWTLVGNNVAAGQFLGSTNNQPLEFKVNGMRALRFEPNTNGAPNLIAGSPYNFVAPDVYGAVIAGGGDTNGVPNLNGKPFTNSVSANFGVIGGGAGNKAQALVSTIGGGDVNTVYPGAYESTIGGGYLNTIQTNALQSTIGGGSGNRIGSESYNATIGGGIGNEIENYVDTGTIGGGYDNKIQTGAYYSTIGGGDFNTASGQYATIPGGIDNLAGPFSFAAGYRAKATHTGSFVWSDSTSADFGTSTNNQFLIRATGGVGIGTTNPITQLTVGGAGAYDSPTGAAIIVRNLTAATGRTWEWHVLDDGRMQLADYTAGATRLLINTSGNVGIGATSPSEKLHVLGNILASGTITPNSDRNAKTDIKPVDTAQILERVSKMPVQQWRFKTEADGVKHIGPMAQDFRTAFGLGAHETAIATVDADGVALAAIQGLNQKMDSENAKLREELKRRDAENAELKQRLEAVEQIIGSQKSK